MTPYLPSRNIHFPAVLLCAFFICVAAAGEKKAAPEKPPKSNPSVLRFSGFTPIYPPPCPPEATPLPVIQHRPSLMTKWISENVPMDSKGGSGRAWSAEELGGKMPWGVRFAMPNSSQVFFLLETSQGVFFSVREPVKVRTENVIPLETEDFCDVSGNRRPFPAAAQLKQLWVWQDGTPGGGPQARGWVQWLSAPPPGFEARPKRVRPDAKNDLPSTSVKLTRVPALSCGEPVVKIRRLAPSAPHADDGETWILHEGPFAYQALGNGEVRRVGWAGRVHITDVARTAGVHWVGTAHQGLWSVQNNRATRRTAKDLDLGRTVWRVETAKDGSVAFLTERGVFGKKSADAADPFVQITGPLEDATALLHRLDSVWAFRPDGFVVRYWKQEGRCDWTRLAWPKEDFWSTPYFVTTDVCEGGDGSLILGTNHGLFRGLIEVGEAPSS